MNDIVEKFIEGDEIAARALVDLKNNYQPIVDDEIFLELINFHFPYGVKKLLSLGANVCYADADGNQAVHLNCCGQDDSEVLEELISFGADVNAKNLEGQTALMLSAKFNELKLIEILIEAGADIHAVDRMGRNALHYCAMFGDYAECARLLINVGAEPSNLAINGQSVVDYANGLGRSAILQLICKTR